jgi:hypothetical protein
VTRVGNPAMRVIWLPEGHSLSEIALLPGVFSYSRTIRNPTPMAQSHTTTPNSNNQVDRFLNRISNRPRFERILELKTVMKKINENGRVSGIHPLYQWTSDRFDTNYLDNYTNIRRADEREMSSGRADCLWTILSGVFTAGLQEFLFSRWAIHC